MNTNTTISMLKKQLIGTAAGALAALVALSSATYAWYVANNTVKYSLQGTTQGRYLTGGVPPVRFSM